MIKVLLVDDHELVARGIEALLNAMHDMTVLGICDCGEQALEILDNKNPDVILMDINMPGIGGIEACRRVLQIRPQIKLIGLSALNNSTMSKQMHKLGLNGFISKSSPPEEMADAIRTVMDGGRHSPLAIDDHDSSPFATLSQRESEVTRLILQGKSIQEMSEVLQINTKTINTYRDRIKKKLHIKNDVELTHLATRYNFQLANTNYQSFV